MGPNQGLRERFSGSVYVFTWMFVASVIVASLFILFTGRETAHFLVPMLGLAAIGLAGKWVLVYLPFVSPRVRSLLISQINLALVAAVIYLGGPPLYPVLACNALELMRQCSSGETSLVIFTTLTAWGYPVLALLARNGWRCDLQIFLYLVVFSFVIAFAVILGIYSWQRERELRDRLTRMVEDLTKARAEQEEQLAKIRETHLLLEERYAETYALYLIQQELATELELEKILPKVTDIILGLLGGRSCIIMLADREKACLRQAVTSGRVEEEMVFPLEGEHALARCWTANRPLSHLELTEEEWSFWRARGVNGLLCHPLTTKEERIGLILVEYDYLPQSLEDHRDLLSLVAGQLSLALENVALYQKVREMANHDALTGLANRHFFQEKLKEEMAVADKTRPLAAVIMDLDHFKRINDEYGHEAGDEVLRFTARLLTEKLGEGVTVARYGGEEFLLLLPGRKSGEAVAIAETVRQKLKETACLWEGQEIRITASFGVAVYPEQARDRRSLLRLADRALYEAKKERDKVVLARE